jgi:hypothetical protein
MLTGTPLDLTPFGSVLSGIGLLYWLLAGAGLWWALRGQRPWYQRMLRALPVLLLFGFFPARTAWDSYQWQQRSRAAQAHFEMRCKSAGETVKRTVDNVEGIVWMKWRERYDVLDDYDQFKLSDPYGRDCDAEGCIEQLLRPTKGLELAQERKASARTGFAFVETIDPRDGKAYRYTLRLLAKDPQLVTAPDPKLERVAVDKLRTQYGITWEDISTREDREHWIAGGSLKVIDMQTNEVIAERVGYMMDRGLGSRTGFRTPWLYAQQNACPRYPGGMHRYPTHDSVLFALKVLQPKQ